jgi:lysophospholipase L1-like esterase
LETRQVAREPGFGAAGARKGDSASASESAAPPSRGRAARFKRAGCALVVSTVLGLFAAELVSRAMFGAPLAERLPLMEVRANKTRGFEMIPNSEHYTYLEHVRVNNLGLRGDDVREKEPDELRVLALGDSLTYGQGMAEDGTLPHQIEIALRERTRNSAGARAIRVINGGVRAYNTRQELALLTEMWERVKPDVVVLFWFANDVDDPDIDALCRRFETTGPVVFDLGEPLGAKNELVWRAKQIARQSALVMKVWHAYSESHWPVETPEMLDRAFTKLDLYMDEFARLAKAGEFEFMVAVVPLARIAREPDAEHPLTKRVKTLAEAHGFPFLDLVAPVRELCRSSGRVPVLAYDGHYDASANAALGQCVADELWKRFRSRFMPK